MTYTATYSPDDNKLRLYASGRLPSDLYARVKAAGFKWAPKQDLFVAPMWTPQREDLLLELADDIDDEDKSLTDRAQERAERFDDYSDKRASDAESARKAVSAIADNIPLGQPILVGHHSERHARRDAENIENGMRRAVKMWETSKYWEDRARGAIRHAKYKERPDVRARRIKTIEADLRKLDRADKTMAATLKVWAFVDMPEKWKPREDGSQFTREERAENIAGRLHCTVKHEGARYWTAYDVLRLPAEERYKDAPVMTVDEVMAAVRASEERAAEIRKRWRAHYENRLTYERAMLADAGGTIADQVKPEKGGACKCWASPRGGWSLIKKVNRISVTVLDNWGNGGRDFTRTIPFDKLAALMSLAQVDEARAAGRIVGEDARGFGLLSEAQKPQPAPRPKEGEAFEAMRESLRSGAQVITAPQLFPTPNDLAARMVELADIQPGQRVLEPSAGTGALIGAMGGRMFGQHPNRPDERIGALFAVEVNAKLCERLRAEFPLTAVHCGDFLQWGNTAAPSFDRIVMNPPFENAADIKHIQHALAVLKPGGLLVAICANGPRQRDALQPIAREWIDLQPGTFKEQGTGVNTALVLIDKEPSDSTPQDDGELALAEQTKEALAQKARQAKRGKVEQRAAALLDRDVCILSAPAGTTPPRELKPQPIVQLGLPLA